MTDQRAVVACAGLIALGLALAGSAAGFGFARGRAGERFVSVKGVAEREVRADLAIWPVRVTGAGNDLATANAQVASSVNGVKRFLARHGLDTTQVELTAFGVSDAEATEYGMERRRPNRFVIHQTLVLRSNLPDLVLAASQQLSDLAAVGVAISSGHTEYGPSGGPTFIFSGLNELKPSMIADATARAREAGEQFARDSRSELGAIRQANQGLFSILPRDQAPGISQEGQIAKIVRVVSTIDYYLK